MDDFARFLKLFGDFLTNNDWKLAKIRGFWHFSSTLISRPKKGAKSQGEKSEDFQ